MFCVSIPFLILSGKSDSQKSFQIESRTTLNHESSGFQHEQSMKLGNHDGATQIHWLSLSAPQSTRGAGHINVACGLCSCLAAHVAPSRGWVEL